MGAVGGFGQARLRRQVQRDEHRLAALEGRDDRASAEERADVLVDVGHGLTELGDLPGAVHHYALAAAELRRFASHHGKVVALEVVRGNLLVTLKRFVEAADVLGWVIDAVGVGGALPSLQVEAEDVDDLLASGVRSWLVALQELGRFEQAGAAGETVIREFGRGSTENRRKAVVQAHLAVAAAADQMGDMQRALESLRQAATGGHEQLELGVAVANAQALLEHASVLERLGQTAEAVERLDELLARFGRVRYEALQLLVAVAKDERGRLLGEQPAMRSKHHRELSRRLLKARRGLDAAATAEPNPSGAGYDHEPSGDTAQGASGQHAALTDAEEPRWRKIAECEAILAETKGSVDDADLRRRGVAFADMGRALLLLRRYAKAVEYYRQGDEILWRYESLLSTAIRCRQGMATALRQCGHPDEALQVTIELIDRVGLSPSLPVADGSVVSIAVSWLDGLQGQGRWRETVAAADKVIEAFAPGSTGPQSWALARAFRLRGVAAQQRGEEDAALTDFEAAIAHANAGMGLPDAQRVTTELNADRAQAMVHRAGVLAQQGQTDAAAAACNEVITQHGSDASQFIKQVVTNARALLETIDTIASP